MNKFDGTDINATGGLSGMRPLDLKSLRAMMIFCWLPPESERTAATADGVRISNSAMSWLAQAAMLRSTSPAT